MHWDGKDANDEALWGGVAYGDDGAMLAQFNDPAAAALGEALGADVFCGDVDDLQDAPTHGTGTYNNCLCRRPSTGGAGVWGYVR